ncbi:MAG TPA: M48 family metalloprotease [Smithella sp.]|nr:M48 family metalloprotease [Smithella sp.]
MRKFTQNQYIYFAVVLIILLLRANLCLADFTIEDERKLGREFYDQMEQHHLILKNEVLNSYVTRIGNLIQGHANKVPFEFHFSIIDSDAINAFNTPGGYVYINKGLISAAENEAELAAVIAHELGHANGRHVADMIEKSKKLNVATLAAIIAGAFLGGGGEATAAIAALSVAGASSLSLKFTREHEEEADRLGLGYLVAAGYYPEAMADFLKIMKRYESFSKSMPSYLQTHPGTDVRIFYIESLIAAQYPQKGEVQIIGNFSRMQALIPLDQLDLNNKYTELTESLKKNPDNVDLLYFLALVEDQLGQTSSALKDYLKALSLSPRDEDVLRNLGLIYVKMGEPGLGQSYLLRAAALNANDSDVTFALGKTYLDSGDYQKALDCFLKLEKRVMNDKDLYYQIAMAYGKLNNQGESHYYFGLHFRKEKKKESALFHFREALNYFPKDSQRSIAISQAIKDLESGGNQKPMGKAKP